MEIVDQYYWLGYAKKSVDESTNKLDDTAGKISTLVATFWAIYIAVFTIGATFKKLDEDIVTIILLILPIPLLIFSYMAALWAQLPGLSLEGIDPRAPVDVMNAYNKNTKNKKIRVWISLAIFMLAGLSLTVALVLANFTHEKSDKIILITADETKIFISGDLPDKTIVHYSVVNAKKVIVKQDSTRILQGGHFDRSLDVPQKTDYIVLVNWKDTTDTDMIQQVSKAFVQAKEAAPQGKVKTSPKK